MGGKPLNKPIVGMAATRTGSGTGWSPPTAASSTSATPASSAPPGGVTAEQAGRRVAPATPDGRGYWIAASDGGIFNYGDANFYGSEGGAC